MRDPKVNFGSTFISNVDPDIVLERICQEWRRNGGNKLWVQELRSRNAKPAIVLYEMYNKVNPDAVTAEATRLVT